MESLQRPLIDKPLGKPHGELTRAPAGHIATEMEIALQELERIGLQTAPVVAVDEAGGGDAGSGRDRTQLFSFDGAEWPVDGLKLVILIFAYSAPLDSAVPVA